MVQNTFSPVPRAVKMLKKPSRPLHKVSLKVTQMCSFCLGIYKIESQKKPEQQPKLKKGRGAVRAGGVQDFAPDNN